MAELDYYQKRYDRYRELSEGKPFQYRAAEEESLSKYFIEKYKFLTSLNDEKQINKLLADDVFRDLVASFDYSDEEKKQLAGMYEQTKNRKLGKLLKSLA